MLYILRSDNTTKPFKQNKITCISYWIECRSLGWDEVVSSINFAFTDTKDIKYDSVLSLPVHQSISSHPLWNGTGNWYTFPIWHLINFVYEHQYWDLNKVGNFLQMTVLNSFSWKQLNIFQFNFIEVCSKDFLWSEFYWSLFEMM